MPEKSKILIVTDGYYELPSYYVRALQFKTFFEGSENFQYSFFSTKSKVLEILYLKTRQTRYLKIAAILIDKISSLIKSLRIKKLIKIVTRYNVVYFIKNTDIQLQDAVFKKGIKIVYDVNDGLWLPSFRVPNFNEFLLKSHLVICENKCLAEYVKKFNNNLAIVPDAPQLESFIEFEKKGKLVDKLPGRIRIGWVGGQRNVDALYYLVEELERLANEFPQIELRIVGASMMLPRFEKLNYSFVPTYTHEEMIAEILTFDIGIFPQFHFEDAPLRGTLKAKVYMCGGIGVVAQNIGGMNELIEDGKNGFLADEREEWEHKLRLLITDTNLRKSLGEAARKEIALHFSQAEVFSLLEKALLQVK